VAAFVLKYRLLPTEVRDEDFQKRVEETLSDLNKMRVMTRRIAPLAIADGQQAMKVVRQRASQWGIAPDRIGIMGSSAGGRHTLGVVLEHDKDGSQNLAASIYGAFL